MKPAHYRHVSKWHLAIDAVYLLLASRVLLLFGAGLSCWRWGFSSPAYDSFHLTGEATSPTHAEIQYQIGVSQWA